MEREWVECHSAWQINVHVGYSSYARNRVYRFSGRSPYGKRFALISGVNIVLVYLGSFQELKSLKGANPLVLSRAFIEAKYDPFLQVQSGQVALFQQELNMKIPPEFSYIDCSLSNEVLQRVSKHRPTSIAELKRLEGITPDAVLRILYRLKKCEHAIPALSDF